MQIKTAEGFDINFVFLAYVPPYRDGKFSSALLTDTIRKRASTTDYLFRIFDSAIREARIEIIFNSDNKQNNNIRNEILSITQKPHPVSKIAHARKLAQRLYEETDERNGTGLFVIMEGIKAKTTRIVLMRFKGDEGLIKKGKASIDYISEIFTKKSNHYKLAVYEDVVSKGSFWKGYSADKQISSNQYKSISVFWVEDFLDSKTAITPAQGTLQFSKIIRTILSKTSNIEEQEQIVSAVVNLKNKRNVQISLADFCGQYLNGPLTQKIREETNDDFFNSVFAVDSDVYKKEMGKTVLSIADGITAFVPTFKYKDHVIESVNKQGVKEVTITGKLTGKKIGAKTRERGKKKS